MKLSPLNSNTTYRCCWVYRDFPWNSCKLSTPWYLHLDVLELDTVDVSRAVERYGTTDVISVDLTRYLQLLVIS